MTTDSAEAVELRPGHFCRLLLNAMAASEGRRRRRKRDTTPDALGMELKRQLMARAAEEDPAPEALEAWLLEQAITAPDARLSPRPDGSPSPAGGPVYAMCAEILDEYRVARLDPGFERWLAAGAFSEDADEEDGGRGDGEKRRGGERRAGPGWREDQYAREGGDSGSGYDGGSTPVRERPGYVSEGR